MLVEVWVRWRFHGLRAYVAKMRGADVIKPLRSPEYEAAKTFLADWEYEPD
jgi:hypothetical protein